MSALPDKRTFLNFGGLIAELSRKVRLGKVLSYHGNESLRETIRLFASASVVFGYHGAGFTNMLFSRPGTTGIEIFTRRCQHKYSGFNYRITAAAGVNWRVLIMGTPFLDEHVEERRPAHDGCKPPYVAWSAKDDLPELSALIDEEPAESSISKLL